MLTQQMDVAPPLSDYTDSSLSSLISKIISRAAGNQIHLEIHQWMLYENIIVIKINTFLKTQENMLT